MISLKITMKGVIRRGFSTTDTWKNKIRFNRVSNVHCENKMKLCIVNLPSNYHMLKIFLQISNTSPLVPDL